jgi:putative transposase
MPALRNHKITEEKPMPEYRRAYVPGGTYFFTLVTYNRTPLFAKDENISRLRSALSDVKAEMPFEIEGAVVLPDHIHFLWTLPSGDINYSKRVGRLKVFARLTDAKGFRFTSFTNDFVLWLFTRALRGRGNLPQNVSTSRRKHRESDSRLLRIRVSLFMWQRRFFQHTIGIPSRRALT